MIRTPAAEFPVPGTLLNNVLHWSLALKSATRIALGLPVQETKATHGGSDV
jgi:hypothetical protein